MHGKPGKKRRERKRMDKFICLSVEHNGEFLWCVFEQPTEQVINSFYFEEDAHEYIRFLNQGGAFGGWTPAYILNEFKTKRERDINKQFAHRL